MAKPTTYEKLFKELADLTIRHHEAQLFDQTPERDRKVKNLAKAIEDKQYQIKEQWMA